jgi:hypothetical protein
MVAGGPIAVFGGRGVSLLPPQAAMAGVASGTAAAVVTMRRDAQRELICPMIVGAAAAIDTPPRSADRPPDRRPSPGRSPGPRPAVRSGSVRATVAAAHPFAFDDGDAQAAPPSTMTSWSSHMAASSSPTNIPAIGAHDREAVGG